MEQNHVRTGHVESDRLFNPARKIASGRAGLLAKIDRHGATFGDYRKTRSFPPRSRLAPSWRSCKGSSRRSASARAVSFSRRGGGRSFLAGRKREANGDDG